MMEPLNAILLGIVIVPAVFRNNGVLQEVVKFPVTDCIEFIFKLLGKEAITDPVEFEKTIPFVALINVFVPVISVTPLLMIVTAPEVAVTLIPVPDEILVTPVFCIVVLPDVVETLNPEPVEPIDRIPVLAICTDPVVPDKLIPDPVVPAEVCIFVTPELPIVTAPVPELTVIPVPATADVTPVLLIVGEFVVPVNEIAVPDVNEITPDTEPPPEPLPPLNGVN